MIWRGYSGICTVGKMSFPAEGKTKAMKQEDAQYSWQWSQSAPLKWKSKREKGGRWKQLRQGECGQVKSHHHCRHVPTSVKALGGTAGAIQRMGSPEGKPAPFLLLYHRTALPQKVCFKKCLKYNLFPSQSFPFFLSSLFFFFLEVRLKI